MLITFNLRLNHLWFRKLERIALSCNIDLFLSNYLKEASQNKKGFK